MSEDKMYVVEGDVDKDIDVQEAVTIKGSVKSGVVIKSQSDIVILGDVKEARIATDGSVTIKGEFKGQGKGMIQAKRDVIIKSCDGQKIYCRNNLTVEDGLIHAIVEVERMITVSGPTGVIGGSISAGDSIDVTSAGAATHTVTYLKVGFGRESRKIYSKYEEDKKQNLENTKKMQQVMTVLNKIKLLKNTLKPAQEKILEKVSETYKILTEEKQILEKKIDIFVKMQKTVAKSEIFVRKKIYPGVHIEFGDKKTVIKKTAEQIRFYMENNLIRVISIN